MIHIVFYGIFIDYDLSGATGQPIEEGKTFTETQPHTEEDAVENEMVILPPLMEPENGKKEEGKAIPAEEGKGDADEEREEASETGEMVENPFFNGLDEEGDNDSKMDGAVGESKGFIIKREAEDQEAKEEAEELKEREEEERTRKEHEEEERRAKEKREAERKLKEEHEAEQRVEGEAERQAKEMEVAEKEAREKERMNRARMMEEMLRDHYEEKSEKEKREREALGQARAKEAEEKASLEEARIAWILLGCLQMLSGKPSSEQDKEKETPANGHVATLSTEERIKGIKEEITLDEE